MKIKLFLLATLLFAAASVQLNAQTNFTGTWKRDSGQTRVSDGLSINSLPTQIEVQQDSRELSIKRTAVTASGQVTVYTEKFTAEGKFLSSDWKSDRRKIVAFKWSPDKKTLTAIATYLDAAGKPLQLLDEIWSLSAEGNTLRISAKMEVLGRGYTAESVFVKAEH